MLESLDIRTMALNLTSELAQSSYTSIFTDKKLSKCEQRNFAIFSFVRQNQINSINLTAPEEECMKYILGDSVVSAVTAPEFLDLQVIEFGCNGEFGIFTVTSNVINGELVVLQVQILGVWYSLAVDGNIVIIPDGQNETNYQFDYDNTWNFGTLRFRLFDISSQLVSPSAFCETFSCTKNPILNEDQTPLDNEDGTNLLAS